MTPPRVLMLGWELPPYNSGGLGEACFGLAKALSRKGVRITFVLPKKLNLKVDFMDLVFADVDEITKLYPVYTTGYSWRKFVSFDSLPPDFVHGALKFAEKVEKLAEKYHSDIVHAHDWMTYPAGIAAKEVLSKPLVAHVHSTEFDRTGGHYPNQTVYRIEREGLEKADAVLPVGGFMKQVLIDKYHVEPSKIRVVYNGIDEPEKSELAPALSAFKDLGYKIVLYLGRITLQKGPEYFVRAAKKVLQYNPKVIFVVTGSGDMQDFMLYEAANLGIINKFIFTGFLRGDERDRVYQSADIYVMPSVSEPFGITALEAISNHTPVLVSKQSGVSEILQHALKADFWDIDEMANKILAVLSYNALSSDLRHESSKEIRNFSWARSADTVLDVYRHLI
ncbi:hypothetical protein A3D01_02310 [Candidatus Woesebacteria bacterium RIFCSPHIGHO2_02_FULL_39_13]|uniref:4-alpha-glucanotransferase n=1 Tax=Candidatus Woesebacteria bacterium RIFCSPHIGHO2_02_FULL_39_13 TaxID=1802505 RepID=A0A1F7Z2N1_9BACT|nr:MAG: hypothetical protein A3D01_02310 [Candidatus Woesebacteria bacterium RIFCSPHIGHO2_02_FULL_39_13]